MFFFFSSREKLADVPPNFASRRRVYGCHGQKILNMFACFSAKYVKLSTGIRYQLEYYYIVSRLHEHH